MMGITLLTIDELEKLGASNPCTRVNPKLSDLAIIMFTSGSTGNPKGVLITHHNIASAIQAIEAMTDSFGSYLSYLPLSHILELAFSATMISNRVPIAYSNRKTLTDEFVFDCKGDLREWSPRILAAVPLVCERIRRGILLNVAKKPIAARVVFFTALAIKETLLQHFASAITSRAICAVLDKILFHKIKELVVGGGLRILVTGGAPISPSTQSFLRATLCCNVCVGYGATETAALITGQSEDDYSCGSCGLPFCVTKVKLVDVPSLNYSSESGTGEICVKGTNVSPGYYNLPAETLSSFDAY
eukprot:TRINITY_DN1053_c0_g1_i7.p1 TRINITY_DN1053_c0_g1~~TRINITY_DN1053_c0_g1_i7.p1  ORF type:complete len:335 (-),score=66.54 TRINITY_DN1053_c0_g1_i7:129-1037(-)